MHTRAFDSTVVFTPLNPGVPILLIGSYISIEHFGAVTTVLPDSTTLVLRAIPNHPLGLEPGDVILGYEGIHWKVLVKELLEGGLPMIAMTGGCKTADTYLNLSGVGLNWHLFDTIDILKYSSGDIEHLSVLPLLNLNIAPSPNNEQLPIPNIPFPKVLQFSIDDTVVTYGLLPNTNIGYIYLAKEFPQETSEEQFFKAVNELKNTDALIIDMRLNFGGWAFFDKAFEILFNESALTIEDSYRCKSTTFDLCPSGNAEIYKINVKTPNLYDRPIAVLVGPTCVSMGDLTIHRLRYHPMVKFFGSSSNATFGDSRSVDLPGWWITYSIGDMFHVSTPGIYLNRREFPIDYHVWHNINDAAQGKDAVVEKALSWITNMVFPHNIISDKKFYNPEKDSVHLRTTINNPNSHQLTARAYICKIDSIVIDSLNLYYMNSTNEWKADFKLPQVEEFYKVSVKVFDETNFSSFTLPNATYFTTTGPIIPLLDSIGITVSDAETIFFTNIGMMNKGLNKTIENITVKFSSIDTIITQYITEDVEYEDLNPGEFRYIKNAFGIKVKNIPNSINIITEISSNGKNCWVDTFNVLINPVSAKKDPFDIPDKFKLCQNYPNPFNPTTKIKYSIPANVKSEMSNVKLAVFDILGKEVATIVNQKQKPGNYEVEFDGSNLTSGVYFYKLQSGDFIETKKMLLIK